MHLTNRIVESNQKPLFTELRFFSIFMILQIFLLYFSLATSPCPQRPFLKPNFQEAMCDENVLAVRLPASAVLHFSRHHFRGTGCIEIHRDPFCAPLRFYFARVHTSTSVHAHLQTGDLGRVQSHPRVPRNRARARIVQGPYGLVGVS